MINLKFFFPKIIKFTLFIFSNLRNLSSGFLFLFTGAKLINLQAVCNRIKIIYYININRKIVNTL